MRTKSLLLLAIGIICSFAVNAATAPKPAPLPPQSEIVELPAYTVTDSRMLPPEESWRYAAIPGFEILSDASDHATKRFIDEFQRVQIGIRLIWPDIITTKPTVPTLILLCAKNSYNPLVPASEEYEMALTPNSFFVEDKERGAIVINLAAIDILDGAGNIFIADPYSDLYRQYARFLMRRANAGKPIPAWLETGLSQMFTSVDLENKSLEFGRYKRPPPPTPAGAAPDDPDGNNPARNNYIVSDASGGNTAGAEYVGGGSTEAITDPHGFVLRAFSSAAGTLSSTSTSVIPRREPPPESINVIPLEKLFSPDIADHSDPYWATQSYAFVHMCLYGAQKRYQQAFMDFAQIACARDITEADFTRCFGKNYAAMTNILRGYINAPHHQYIRRC